MRNVYLDNNATTRVAPEVVEAMLPFFSEDFGNPSSVHKPGRTARKAVDHARWQVASLVNCDPSEVVFTSGGSEAINMAIKGIMTSRQEAVKHCITTRVEHSAVINSCRFLEEKGFQVTWLDIDTEGTLTPGAVEAAITEQTALISVMYANNETGVIFPIREIGEIASRRGIPFLCDAVQAVGKIPVNFKELPADFLTVSGHKFHAPKGTGALIVRKGIDIGPLIHGGSQERRRRGGTENVPGIVGFGAACEIARKKLETESARIMALRLRFEQRIMELIPNVKLNGHQEKRLPNTCNISFIGANAELLLTELDRSGVAVSAGSACTSGNRTISHVLGAMGLDDATARSAIRFSLGRENTDAHLDYVLDLLPDMVEKLRRKKTAKPCITITTQANSVFD